MPRNWRVIFAGLFLLVCFAGCSREKSAPPAPASEDAPKIFNAAFLHNFSEGWVLAFLRPDRSEQIKNLLRQNPGWQALFEGQLSEAIQAFKARDDRNSQIGLGRSLLERAVFYQNSYQAALNYQRRFLKYRQENTNLVKPSLYLMFYLGKNKLLAGDSQKAVADLSYFLQKQAPLTFQTRARVLLGLAYHLKGEPQKARDLWEEARQNSGASLIYYKSEWGFVQGYLGQNLPQALQATQEAWQAVKETENAEKNYFLFNWLYLQLLNGHSPAARELAAEFPWGEPEFNEYIEPQLTLRFYNPFYLKALQLLDLAWARETLTAAAPDSPYLDYYLGQAYLLSEDYPQAAAALQKFVQTKPAFDLAASILARENTPADFLLNARFSLAEVYYRWQKPAEAKKIWQEAFKSQTNNPLATLAQAEITAKYLEQPQEAQTAALNALAASAQLETALKDQYLQTASDEDKNKFSVFYPFYQRQYPRRAAAILVQGGQVLLGVEKFTESLDKQLGYNVSGENQPLVLGQIAQAYYLQNCFNEVVGIYFCLIKDFPEVKQNYEMVKSIYATTTDRGETPR